MKNDKIMIIGATSGVAVELANQLKNFNIIKVSRKQIDVNINLKNYEKLILKYKPKIIINCIVANGIDYCENVPQEAFKVNTALPIYIATICKKIGAKFIHFSTEAIFSGEKFNKSHSEKSKANPKTIYGISKLLADINLLNFNNVLILRVPMLFGPSHKRQLISRLLEQLKKGKKI